MTLAEKMKQLREKKGLKQKEVAALMGISQQAYGQYESGTREPKMDTLNRIAKALGVSKYELLRATLENDADFVNSDWFAEMSDEDILEAVLPPSPNEVENLKKSMIHQKELLDSINNAFYFLNEEGQEEAAKRIEELTQISRYRYQPTTSAPQAAPAGLDDKESTQK